MARYQVARGGHAPEFLRAAFQEYLDQHEADLFTGATVDVDGEPRSLPWLIGQLWNCSDTLPAHCWGSLDGRPGTYAQAVRILRSWERR